MEAKKLLKDAASGDLAAYREFMKESYTGLYPYALTIAKEDILAKNLIAATFTEAWDEISKNGGREAPEIWLKGIMWNIGGVERRLDNSEEGAAEKSFVDRTIKQSLEEADRYWEKDGSSDEVIGKAIEEIAVMRTARESGMETKGNDSK